MTGHHGSFQIMFSSKTLIFLLIKSFDKFFTATTFVEFPLMMRFLEKDYEYPLYGKKL